jgi:hypothetical protein
MRIKIRGGTVQHGEESLCQTCRFATIVRGQRLRDEIVECGQLSGPHSRIAFRVTSCTAYASRVHASLREMEDIAWVLRTDPRRKQIGFVAARDLKPKDRYVLPDDDWPV